MKRKTFDDMEIYTNFRDEIDGGSYNWEHTWWGTILVGFFVACGAFVLVWGINLVAYIFGLK